MWSNQLFYKWVVVTRVDAFEEGHRHLVAFTELQLIAIVKAPLAVVPTQSHLLLGNGSFCPPQMVCPEMFVSRLQGHFSA